MEEKLARYRERKKEKDDENQQGSTLLLRSLQWLKAKPSDQENNKDKQPKRQESQASTQAAILSAPASTSSRFGWAKSILAAILWCLIVVTLAKYELAGPFIVLTAIVCMIHFGTSSGRQRKKTELSAYSVFNPNCVRLEGTFTAEQFENELLRRPLDSKKSS